MLHPSARRAYVVGSCGLKQGFHVNTQILPPSALQTLLNSSKQLQQLQTTSHQLYNTFTLQAHYQQTSSELTLPTSARHTPLASACDSGSHLFCHISTYSHPIDSSSHEYFNMPSHLRLQASFEPLSANATYQTSPPTSPPAKKQKMSLTQTYYVASTARSKLGREANRADHNLRVLVGHANLLDNLMLDLANAVSVQSSKSNPTHTNNQ